LEPLSFDLPTLAPDIILISYRFTPGVFFVLITASDAGERTIEAD
jgi:hypothetical protein